MKGRWEESKVVMKMTRSCGDSSVQAYTYLWVTTKVCLKLKLKSPWASLKTGVLTQLGLNWQGFYHLLKMTRFELWFYFSHRLHISKTNIAETDIIDLFSDKNKSFTGREKISRKVKEKKKKKKIKKTEAKINDRNSMVCHWSQFPVVFNEFLFFLV